MTAQWQRILYQREGDIARITLNQPPLNILDIPMMKELGEALESARREEGLKLLVLDAKGKFFSAGVSVQDHTADKVEEMTKVFHAMFHTLQNLDPPSLALVQGSALGGGCELAIFCDLLLISDRAELGQPEIKVGVFPPVAAAVTPWLMGLKKSYEFLLTGDNLTAAEAGECGLANQVIPAEQWEEAVSKFIGRITRQSSAVLRLTKKAARYGLELHFKETISRLEDLYLGELMTTEDAREGIQSFLEKRKPVWKGR